MRPTERALKWPFYAKFAVFVAVCGSHITAPFEAVWRLRREIYAEMLDCIMPFSRWREFCKEIDAKLEKRRGGE